MQIPVLESQERFKRGYDVQSVERLRACSQQSTVVFGNRAFYVQLRTCPWTARARLGGQAAWRTSRTSRGRSRSSRSAGVGILAGAHGGLPERGERSRFRMTLPWARALSVVPATRSGKANVK